MGRIRPNDVDAASFDANVPYVQRLNLASAAQSDPVSFYRKAFVTFSSLSLQTRVIRTCLGGCRVGCHLTLSIEARRFVWRWTRRVARLARQCWHLSLAHRHSREPMSKIAGKNHIIRRVTLRSHPLHLSAIPKFTRIRLLIIYDRDWTPFVWDR